MGEDEEGTVRALKRHQAAVLPLIGDYGGRIIDTAGDGVLAEFSSVVRAVSCAEAIQRVVANGNVDVPPGRRLQLRIGIQQGDVVFDDNRVFGDGINVAARLESIAEPGGICVSARVHEDVAGKVDLAWLDGGEQNLKNIARPISGVSLEAAHFERADGIGRAASAGAAGQALDRSARFQGVKHEAVLIDDAPEPVLLAADRDDDLIQMSFGRP